MPVAVICWAAPAAKDGLAGVTAMDWSVAAVTVSVVLPEILPAVAVVSDEPTPTPVARPLATTVATEVVPEVHVTEEVMFRDVPSEYVPVAVNCFVNPAGVDGLAGVTAMSFVASGF